MFCYKCGSKLPDDACFCPNCGTDQAIRGAAAPNFASRPPVGESGLKKFLDGRPLPIFVIMVLEIVIALIVPVLLVGKGDNVYYIGNNDWPSKLNMDGSETVFLLYFIFIFVAMFTFYYLRKKALFLIVAIADCGFNYMYSMILINAIDKAYGSGKVLPGNPAINALLGIALIVLAVKDFKKSKAK